MVEKIEFKQDEIEEKNIQFYLKANELKYRTLIENLPQKIFLKDKNSVYISCNNNFAQDLGIAPEGIAGKTDYDFFPEELAEKYRDDDKRIIILGETEDLEESYIYNGEEVYVHTVKTPIKDENGTIIGILGIFWDITRQHKIYKKLVASEHNLLERVKELSCIYELSNLFENPNNTVRDIIRGMIKLIPPAWQFPTITCARILYDKKEFKEDAFRESEWKLSTKTKVNKKDLKIEVFYLEDKPFLAEERYLLSDLGNRLKTFIEHRETEQQFRFLFEKSPDPIFLMDLNGVLKNCNPEGEKKFGYTREELIGNPFIKFSWFLPKTMPLIMKTFKTLASGEIPEPLEIQQRRKDGTLVWVNVLFSFMTVGEEKLIQVITQDISKIKEAEAKYRKVLENIKEGYYEVDIKGNFTLINEGLCEIFGYRKEELIENHYSKLYDKKNMEIVLNVHNSLFKAGEGFSMFDCEAVKKNGKKIFVESSVYLKNKEDGEIIGYKGFLRNITQRKQAEALEKEFNEILEKKVVKRTVDLNKALDQQKLYLDQIIEVSNFKTEFLATVSHELRTPLNAIIGFTDLLLESIYGTINEEQEGFLHDIQNAAEYQYEMIKHILDISKIESGKVSIKIEKIQLQNLIKLIISSLKPWYSKKKINIKLKGMNKNSFIFADRIKFKQIIFNLLSNALKFTERGSVILNFKDNSKEWVFEIKDTGIGIAEKDLDKIFKDFQRIKSPYVDSTPGSGLGLALIKRIINLHEGEISFISKIGVGTTFRFTIPKIIQELNINKRSNKSYKV